MCLHFSLSLSHSLSHSLSLILSLSLLSLTQLPPLKTISHDSFLDDLDRKLEWAKTHDKEVKKIAEESTKLMAKRMRMEDVYCYMYRLFLEYATRLDYIPDYTPDEFGWDTKYTKSNTITNMFNISLVVYLFPF